MCFSAAASFSAAATLTVAGGIAIHSVRSPRQVPLACIPFLFALQQALEGCVWKSFDAGSVIPHSQATYLYTLFSHIFWPAYVPFAMRLVEPVLWRRRAMDAMLAAGVTVACYLLYYLIMYPVTSRVLGAHIVYEMPHFHLGWVMTIYVAATCISSVMASDRLLQTFGLASIGSFAATYWLSEETLVSVWCFFAALLSVLLVLYLRRATGPTQDIARAEPQT